MTNEKISDQWAKDLEELNKKGFSGIERKVCFFCDVTTNIIYSPITYLLLFFIIAMFSIALIPDKIIMVTALMWALASTSFGILVGLLLAIPNSQFGAPQTTSPVAPAGAATANGNSNKDDAEAVKQRSEAQKNGVASFSATPNTSLSRISDWIVGGAIGITIIERDKIASQINWLGIQIGTSDSYNLDMYAVALLIFFFTIGFLAGYLTTKLYFGPILARADRETLGVLQQKTDALGAATGALVATIQELDTRIRKEEEIASFVSKADEYMLHARIFNDIRVFLKECINEYVDKSLNPADAEATKKAFEEVGRSYCDKMFKEYIARSSIILNELCLFEDPKHVPALIGLATNCRLSGNLDTAITKLSLLIDELLKKPKEETISLGRLYYNRACYKLIQHSYDAALKDLEDAIRLKPYFARFAECDSDWHELLDDKNPKHEKFMELIHAVPRAGGDEK